MYRKGETAIQANGKNRILIVDDEDILRNLIVKFMRKEGYEPIEAEDGESAIELYRITTPTIVLSDVRMPGIDGIRLLKELKKIDPQAVIILMTGFGDEQTLLEALRGGATNFFKKPFNFRELADVINSIIKHKMDIDTSCFFSSSLIEETKKFELLTANAHIFPIINQIAIHLKILFPPSDIINLKIGIEEMITNAIEHGNLHITFDEKNRAISKGQFGKLIRERLEKKNNKCKKVYISSLLKKDMLKIVIRDEGDGFDWRSLPEPGSSNFLSFNGRGIFLTKIFYDEVIFNEIGNEVTIIKYKENQ
ncbi:MAG: response regulator [Spirochaetales bacterium]|nr:response regulator [Spirochaetales bacterium]